jgi:putative tryptophan/tyrosine transport system substrate-binding protein
VRRNQRRFHGLVSYVLVRPPDGFLEVFIQGLRDLGYVEGKNIHIEVRFAEEKADRLPALATELVRLKVDALYAISTPVIFDRRLLDGSSRAGAEPAGRG